LNNLSILKQSGNWLIGVIPNVIVSFLKSDTDAKLIAQPQVRVSEGEKAEILIGDRVPIPTTSFNTSQTVGGNIVPITSFTYQNVGITLQIEPRVHHNQEVTMKVQVEVSQIAGYVDTGSGQSAQPIIGTRNIQTTIRLRDGETNLLAGLIKQEERKTRTGVAGVTDIPILNRIFANNQTERKDQDIILTLTPRIIRIPDITEDDLTTLWVGTEDNMQLRGPTRGLLGESPFARSEETAAIEGDAAKSGGSVTQMAPTGGSTGGTSFVPSAGGEADKGDKASGEETKDEGGAGSPEGAPADSAAGAGEPGARAASTEPTPPAAPAVVRVVPSSPTFRVGDTVVLEVRMENGTNVGSVPFHLRYNTQLLQYVDPASEGPLLGSDGTGTLFLARDSSGGGEIVVGLSRMGGGVGVNGSGSLGTFTFRAVKPGRAVFTFSGASVKDPQARNLPASFVSATVGIEP
jgi:general secretion pathway protein D